MISATLDSSAWIRGRHLGGPAGLIIGQAQAGNIRIDISDPIIDETMRVLRDKFQWPGELTHHTRGELAKLCNHVSPVERLDMIKEDPDDNRILECAAAAKSDYIVSEDKHLLRLGAYAGARIVTIQDFVKLAPTPGRERS